VTLAPHVRAVIAPYVPSGTVPVFAGLGIVVLTADEGAMKTLEGAVTLAIPDPTGWDGEETFRVSIDGRDLDLRWAAVGTERQLRSEFALLLTVQTMHSLYSRARRTWIPL